MLSLIAVCLSVGLATLLKIENFSSIIDLDELDEDYSQSLKVKKSYTFEKFAEFIVSSPKTSPVAFSSVKQKHPETVYDALCILPSVLQQLMLEVRGRMMTMNSFLKEAKAFLAVPPASNSQEIAAAIEETPTDWLEWFSSGDSGASDIAEFSRCLAHLAGRKVALENLLERVHTMIERKKEALNQTLEFSRRLRFIVASAIPHLQSYIQSEAGWETENAKASFLADIENKHLVYDEEDLKDPEWLQTSQEIPGCVVVVHSLKLQMSQGIRKLLSEYKAMIEKFQIDVEGTIERLGIAAKGGALDTSQPLELKARILAAMAKNRELILQFPSELLSHSISQVLEKRDFVILARSLLVECRSHAMQGYEIYFKDLTLFLSANEKFNSSQHKEFLKYLPHFANAKYSSEIKAFLYGNSASRVDDAAKHLSRRKKLQVYLPVLVEIVEKDPNTFGTIKAIKERISDCQSLLQACEAHIRVLAALSDVDFKEKAAAHSKMAALLEHIWKHLLQDKNIADHTLACKQDTAAIKGEAEVINELLSFPFAECLKILKGLHEQLVESILHLKAACGSAASDFNQIKGAEIQEMKMRIHNLSLEYGSDQIEKSPEGSNNFGSHTSLEEAIKT